MKGRLMTEIYIYEGEFEHGEKGYDMIKRGLYNYMLSKGNELTEFPEIKKEEGGKPYFVDSCVEFSLSHSGQMWMCAYSDMPCGLDVQIMKEDTKWEKISERHYGENEKAYVNLWGIDGFFTVWAAKEAFGKMTGRGFFDDMPEMIDNHHELIKKIVYNDKIFYMTEIEIAHDVKCFLCTTDESHSIKLLV